MELPAFLVTPPAVVQSPLRPGECAERLRAGIDGDFMLFGGKPVIGSVGESSARLRKRIWYRNSFQSVMRVTFVDRGTGTEITCRSGMSIFTTVFMVVWFGAVGLFGLAFLGSIFDHAGGGGAPAALFPLGMIAFGVALVLIGRFIARNEHADLLAFVTHVTDAKPVPDRHLESQRIVD